MSSNKKLDDLEKAILREIKNLVDRAPLEISARVSDFLMSPSYKKGLKKSKNGNLYYSEPNTGTRLRSLYGNIRRAITIGKTGNYKSVTYKNGYFYVDFGYNPDTVVQAGNKTTTLKYAAMHEAEDRGKSTSIQRPFVEPGFSKYMEEANGWEALRSEMEERIVQLIRSAF